MPRPPFKLHFPLDQPVSRGHTEAVPNQAPRVATGWVKGTVSQQSCAGSAEHPGQQLPSRQHPHTLLSPPGSCLCCPCSYLSPCAQGTLVLMKTKLKALRRYNQNQNQRAVEQNKCKYRGSLVKIYKDLYLRVFLDVWTPKPDGALWLSLDKPDLASPLVRSQEPRKGQQHLIVLHLKFLI